jgi:hypothetical protein
LKFLDIARHAAATPAITHAASVSRSIRDMAIRTAAWLLLITNLPGRNPTVRMRIWRALKAAGAGLLRDGVYVMPNSVATRRVLEQQGEEIESSGGLVQIVSLDAESPEQNAAFTGLFDRTAEYAEAIRRLDGFKRELPKLRESEARQRLTSINREVAAIIARDFFPGEPRKQMEGLLADAESALNARFSPDEPHAAHLKKLRHRERKDYRGRTWATRERLWIDRVASAWLIQRFIDPDARFVWLKRIADCPKKAVGFDFDGAEFTHVDSKVTFEVLLASFGLDHDPGLTRLAALVHHLDIGGVPTPESAGFASIMTGARATQQDDNALLRVMTPVLDSLYAAYARADEA